MWVRIKGMLYNLNYVANISLVKHEFAFTMVFSDGSDEKVEFDKWDECIDSYSNILSTMSIPRLNEEAMKPIREQDLANNEDFHDD